MRAFFIPYIVVTLGAAGAIIGSMLTAAISGESGGLQRAAWLLMFGFFIKGGGYAIAAAAIGGLITALFDRSSIIVGAVVMALVAFVGHALYLVFTVAYDLGPWGCIVGGALGALLGIPTGWQVGTVDHRSPRARRTGAQPRGRLEKKQYDVEAAQFALDGSDIDADMDVD
jgi:hypothetical protein